MPNPLWRTRFRWLAFTIIAVLPIVASGCGGSSGGGSGNGTVSVAMVDARDPGISAINVTIGRIEANVNGAWTPITTVPQSFNLYDLAKNEAILGSADLPPGSYTQIRLFPTSATVTDDTGTHNVTIPSGVQTGVKINVDYTIGPNEVTTILLDFNAHQSFHKTGNGQYMLQPVIPAVVKVLSGTITGTVTDGTNPINGATITATYTAGSAYALGTAVNTATSGTDGTFKVWALMPGTYSLSVSYTDPTTSATKAGTAANLVVQANQNTPAGTVVLQ